jgi:6-phosphogluconolactonase (cycloisomerase 2 family)
VTIAGPIDVKVDPSGQFLYCANYNDGSVSAYLIGATGGLTLIGTVPSGTDGAGAGTIALAVY